MGAPQGRGKGQMIVLAFFFFMACLASAAAWFIWGLIRIERDYRRDKAEGKAK